MAFAASGGRELVFVDDGSSDDTVAVVDKLLVEHPALPVRLLRRPHRGKGAAVAAGLEVAEGAHAGFCDLDLSTPLDQVLGLLHVARRADVLAIGSRDLAASQLVRPEGRVREALGRAYNRLLQAALVPGVVDTQCGAKVASARVWQELLPRCRESGFAWDAEIVAVARALGIPVREVAVEWRHDPRSRVRVGRDGAAMVWATARIWRNVQAVGAADRRARARPEPAGPATDHWWFRSKAAFVASALRRDPPARRRGAWLADVGAGSGAVSAMLGWNLDRVLAIEADGALVGSARHRQGLLGVRGDALHLPVADQSMGVVCLLDVLEHLADPGAALAEARRAVAPGGRLAVTVPAHPWLWSRADTELGHRRRYTRRSLSEALADAGFRPLVLTHVFSWLVPPVWAERRALRRRAPHLGLDRRSVLVDRAALVLTKLERQAVGRFSSPVGTTVLALAEPHSGARGDGLLERSEDARAQEV